MSLAYETGTATDYRDLMAKYITFLTTDATLVANSEEWTVLASDTEKVYLKGTGLAGTDEIFIGITIDENIGADQYNWITWQSTGYVPGEVPANQPNYNGYWVPLWDQSITYWFTASGRRVTCIMKVDTKYFASYQGFYLPYVRPSLLPYPCFVGGCADVRRQHSEIGDGMNHPWKGNVRRQNSFLDNNYVWRFLNNADHNTPYFYPQENSYPMGKGYEDVEYSLHPYIIVTTEESAQWGELEGVMWVSGEDNSAESTLSIGSVDYLCFPNIYRSGINDWTAIQISE